MSKRSINTLSLDVLCDRLGKSNVVVSSIWNGCEAPRTNGCPLVDGLDNARGAVTLALRWNKVMRDCTFDSAFICITREGTKASPVPPPFAGRSRECPLKRLAGVVTKGVEANEGGDECDVDDSRIARSVTSFLIDRAWFDYKRI